MVQRCTDTRDSQIGQTKFRTEPDLDALLEGRGKSVMTPSRLWADAGRPFPVRITQASHTPSWLRLTGGLGAPLVLGQQRKLLSSLAT